MPLTFSPDFKWSQFEEYDIGNGIEFLCRGSAFDKFGQVYVSTDGINGDLDCLDATTGARVGILTNSEIESFIHTYTGDNTFQWDQNFGFTMLEGGEYVLAHGAILRTTIIQGIVLIQCRDGLEPLPIGFVWVDDDKRFGGHDAYIMDSGTYDDPIMYFGLNVTATTDQRGEFHLIPSVNEIIANDYSAWWANTTAGKNTYEAPNIEWFSNDVFGGDRVDDNFGFLGSSGLNNTRAPHMFKVPGQNKLVWYIHKASMAYHANNANVNRNTWVETEIAPTNDQAFISIDFGTLTPAATSPTGTADDRFFKYTPVLENTLFDTMPQGSDVSIRDGVSTVNGIEYVIPFVFPYGGRFYLPMVRTSITNSEYTDPAFPGELAFPVSVELKIWNGLQFVSDGSQAGTLVTDTQLGETLFDTFFDIEDLRPVPTETGELFIIGRTGTAVNASNNQTTFVGSFGQITSGRRTIMGQIL